MNVRAQQNSTYFNYFFDQLVPCVAGKKVWVDKSKMSMTISEGGKVSITDEAFTELCIINYWDKWCHRKAAKWTDSRAGNMFYKGWQPGAYTEFDRICRRIKDQRESDKRLGSASREQAFLDFAYIKYGHSTNGRNKRMRIEHEGPDLFNDLDD